MSPTNVKTVHQTSLLHIESNLDRLGMLSPTHDQRSQQKNGKIRLQPLLINKSKFLKATHHKEVQATVSLDYYQHFRISIASHREECLMCCPFTKVIGAISKSFSSYRTGTRRQVMRRCFTRNMTPTNNVKTVHQTSLLHTASFKLDQPRIVVAYSQPARS